MSAAAVVLPLQVLILSEIAILREGLARDLDCDERVLRCDACTDVDDAMTRFPDIRPDVVLADASLSDGTAAVDRILSALPQTKVVVFAVAETPDDIIGWAEAGAAGYIPRTAAIADIMPLLTSITANEQPCSARVAAGLFSRLRRVAATGGNGGRSASPAAPTFREMQIIELICAGFSNKEIARRLNIGVATTKSHVHNLLVKLNLQRRTQAAVWLRQNQHEFNGAWRTLPPVERHSAG